MLFISSFGFELCSGVTSLQLERLPFVFLVTLSLLEMNFLSVMVHLWIYVFQLYIWMIILLHIEHVLDIQAYFILLDFTSEHFEETVLFTEIRFVATLYWERLLTLPATFSHLMSLCSILVIRTVFHMFSLLLHLL